MLTMKYLHVHNLAWNWQLKKKKRKQCLCQQYDLKIIFFCSENIASVDIGIAKSTEADQVVSFSDSRQILFEPNQIKEYLC